MSADQDPEGVLGWVEQKIAAVTMLPAGHGEVRGGPWPLGPALGGGWYRGLPKLLVAPAVCYATVTSVVLLVPVLLMVVVVVVVALHCTTRAVPLPFHEGAPTLR